MFSKKKMMISGFLVISIVLGLCHPVEAQADTLYVESDGSRILEVSVSTEFTIDIWIRNFSAPATVMYFTIVYDPNSMEIVTGTTTPPSGWGAGTSIPSLGQVAYIASGAAFQGTQAWYSLTFHCIAEGNTPINVIDAIYTDASGVNQTLNVLKASVNQITHPVGGVASPVNKAEIIAPYIALAGLIAAVSTVYIIKKRRD
ncbi:hypothetical protein ACFLQ6_00315 [Thermoproteota archaeon]